MAESTAQFTTLLPNDVLARVERMRLNPLRRKTNHSRGEHLSGKGGTSTEFADYRDYTPGDDVRYVDWNIFARINHPYLKLYKHEEEMHIVLLVDASRSMQFEGKFDLARQLAAAFGVMGLFNVERVSAYSCRERSEEPVIFPPCTGRASLRRLLRFLEDLPGGGEFPIEAAIEEALKRHRGKGVCVLLSDFLTLGDMTRSFNLLHSAGLEIFALQILGPTELDPELTGDLRFVDSETEQTLDVSSVGELLGLYHEHREALANHLAALCRKRQGRFLTVSSGEDVKNVLFDRLLRRGWVR
ncbi:MAG: DUF58 domain-containing protein [Planctomycetaceae bacterium]